MIEEAFLPNQSGEGCVSLQSVVLQATEMGYRDVHHWGIIAFYLAFKV